MILAPRSAEDCRNPEPLVEDDYSQPLRSAAPGGERLPRGKLALEPIPNSKAGRRQRLQTALSCSCAPGFRREAKSPGLEQHHPQHHIKTVPRTMVDAVIGNESYFSISRFVIRIDTTAANIEIKTNSSPVDVGCGPVMTYVLDKASRSAPSPDPSGAPDTTRLSRSCYSIWRNNQGSGARPVSVISWRNCGSECSQRNSGAASTAESPRSWRWRATSKNFRVSSLWRSSP
jgi:hypothetical protein